MRAATPADTRALVEFNLHAFRHPDTNEQEAPLGAWVRDLMRSNHPTVRPGDYLLVEDTRAGKIVSSMCLIPQTWQYDGIAFGVGRPEVVVTDDAYRRRGLIRAQFEVLHQRSAARGDLVQAITGIPNFYRQFGYEFALALEGARLSDVPQDVPSLKKGERESYRIRRATNEDRSFIARLYEQGVQRSLVSCLRDPQIWQYELAGRSRENANRLVWTIIETVDGTPIGTLAHREALFRERLNTWFYELAPGVSWFDVTPAVMRYLYKVGVRAAARENKVFNNLAFFLGAEHPAYAALGARAPRTFEPYAWYLRVADVPAFLTRIAPVLNRRLAASSVAGFNGALRLNFYRGGAQLSFEQGTLTSAEQWQPIHVDLGHSGFGNAAFPDLTFLQLLFGYRSLREIKSAFTDCLTDSDQTVALLDALFPKRFSDVLPIF